MINRCIPPPALSGSGYAGRRAVSLLSAWYARLPVHLINVEYRLMYMDCQEFDDSHFASNIKTRYSSIIIEHNSSHMIFSEHVLPPLIRFDNVTYRHLGSSESTPPALNDISITIEPGEWVAIVGSNGSGKTTFARHCNALLLPTTGKVTINELDTANRFNHTNIRSQVGMVFQNPEDQIISSVIEEDCAFGPENLGVPTREIKERVERSLKSVEMYEQRLRPPHLLSAGQMQRVALAGVLAMQPNCIIFDESTAMLDPRGRLEVMNTMRSLHERGITVLFITHFMEEAARADRVLVFGGGQILFDGSPKTLFYDPSLLTQCGLEQPITLQLLNGMRQIHPLLVNLSTDFETALRQIPPYIGSVRLPPTNLKQLSRLRPSK